MSDPKVTEHSTIANLQFILVILSIATAVLPVLFSWVVYKLLKIFVSREEFEMRFKAFESVAQVQRQAIIDRQGDLLSRIVDMSHKVDAVLEAASAAAVLQRRNERDS